MMEHPDNSVTGKIGKTYRLRSEALAVEQLPERWVELSLLLNEKERIQEEKDKDQSRLPQPARIC